MHGLKWAGVRSKVVSGHVWASRAKQEPKNWNFRFMDVYGRDEGNGHSCSLTAEIDSAQAPSTSSSHHLPASSAYATRYIFSLPTSGVRRIMNLSALIPILRPGLPRSSIFVEFSGDYCAVCPERLGVASVMRIQCFV